RRALQGERGALEHRVEIQLQQVWFLQRAHREKVAMVLRPVHDVVEDGIVQGPERVALIPRQEQERGSVDEPIEIEIVRSVIAGQPVLFGQEILDREMPDEFREVEKRRHVRSPVWVGGVADRLAETRDYVTLWVVLKRL